ncbi:diphosphate--fructose-6-phosphate 1-phosphotransferase [Propionispora hippei]|uniref:Pyrophosphate--fructose 6-phosphate 1-phosphotransferase n=1 Tax=Propionispora hippei DSM 15287 TaxID=1123003 RepID=A0A1M6LYR1_9FIRM|nr:diphosphate--fructose-6-phosphate 1-phosphotransferase [Propionispora hippei]SHJ76305.1 6-phosphofructokinase 1 [Propionispora hippei DSM 15287]
MSKNTVAILCGGGPAPGMNGVISGVTIAARNNGWDVIGVYEGFSHLAKGEKKVTSLTVDDVSKIHLQGGSIIHTARFNPTKNEEHLKTAISTLRELGVTHLVTIGGDDTAYSASTVASYAKKNMGIDFSVVHVPKTIDNDLPLPEGVPTFGFETARQVGADIATNILEDAKTAQRWFIGIAMGRTAGHLPLGIGKSAAAQVTIIPEDFTDAKVHLSTVVDIIAGSVIKRLADGKGFGLAVVAEGIIEKIPEEDLSAVEGLERDEHGHIRYAEINFGELLKKAVIKRLAELGIKMNFVTKDIGYETRCASPNAFDIEYTRDLGYSAVEFLKNGGADAIITVVNGEAKPLPFSEMLDPVTKKTAVRFVNVNSVKYKIARAMMTLLTAEDFKAGKVEKLAAVTNLSVDEFTKQFNK